MTVLALGQNLHPYRSPDLSLAAAPRRHGLRWMLATVIALSGLGCFSRSHVQQAGGYAVALTDTMRDECSLSQTLGTTWNGSMQTAGDRAWIQMLQALFDIQLVGSYLENVEQFSLDGTAGDVPSAARGSNCLVDRVAVHLDGTTDSGTVFHGAIRIRYESMADPNCVCQLWGQYRADHQ